MKNSLAVILLLLFNAISAQNHLEPIKKIDPKTQEAKNYVEYIFNTLYKGFSEKPAARYCVMPAFKHEYAFSIEKDKNQYFLIENASIENYREVKNKNKIIVSSNKIKISKNLYWAIADLFRLLEKQTKEPDTNRPMLDGSIYMFETTGWSGSVSRGRIRSPDEGSLMRKVVNLCNKIYFFGRGGTNSGEGLELEIEQLLSELKKL